MTRQEAINEVNELDHGEIEKGAAIGIINSIYDQLETLERNISAQEKQVDYWKLSFNKQCQATRKPDGNITNPTKI